MVRIYMLIALTAISFSLNTSCMEQQPMRPLKGRTLTISIPQQPKHISSDEEESPTSRTSGSSPLRVARSGSPLHRINSRQNIVSPRIQKEMLENPKLSPKDKNLTPRSKLLYDFFGDAWTDGDSSPHQRQSHRSRSPQLNQRTSSSGSSSSFEMSGDKLTAIQKNLHSSATIERVLEDVKSQDNDNNAQPTDAHFENPYAQSTPFAVAYIARLKDQSNTAKCMQLFPDMFGNTTVYNAINNPCIALQIGMITNDKKMVEKSLKQSRAVTQKLYKNIQRVTAKLTFKILKETNTPADLATFIKARHVYLTEIVKHARPHAERASLIELLGSSDIVDEASKSEFWRGHQIIGLTSILLDAHQVKCNMLETQSLRTHYMNTVSEINTLVFDAFERERKVNENIQDCYDQITVHLNAVRAKKRNDLVLVISEAHQELKKLIDTFSHLEKI